MKKKIKNLTPSFAHTRSMEQELSMLPLTNDRPLGANIGGLSMYSDAIRRGQGNETWGVDSRGFWMGAAEFEDAPLQMYYNGNVQMRSENGGMILNTQDVQFLLHDGTTYRALFGDDGT